MFKKIIIVSLTFSTLSTFSMQAPVKRVSAHCNNLKKFIDVCDAKKYDEDLFVSFVKQDDMDLSLAYSNGLRALDIVLRNYDWPFEDRFRAIKILVGYKASLRYAQGTSSPLHYVVMWYADKVAYSTFVVLFKYMLQHGANLNAQDEQGDTPLHIASYNKDLPGIILLLDYGASSTVKNNQGKTFFDLLQKGGKDTFCHHVMAYLKRRSSQ